MEKLTFDLRWKAFGCDLTRDDAAPNACCSREGAPELRLRFPGGGNHRKIDLVSDGYRRGGAAACGWHLEVSRNPLGPFAPSREPIPALELALA